MKKLVHFLLIVSLSGCTPDSYRRSADRQVAKILRDRKEQALGYQPQTEVPADPDPLPAKKAFARVPLTVQAPQGVPPLERRLPAVPTGPMGPHRIWPENVPPPAQQAVESAAARSDERFLIGPVPPWQMPKRLDLFTAIDYAVEHSRQYQTQMESLYLAALDVTLERHLFSPRPFARIGTGISGGQGDVNYRAALSSTASAGVRQQLPYGGEIVAETLVRFVQAINGNVNEGESAEVALSGSIPLLRGAGMVNLEPLIQSERDLIYQVRDFEEFRRSFAVSVASNYFSLLTQQQGVNNRRTNYGNLSLLTERTQALYAAGRIGFLEVQRSLQAQLSAENSLTNSLANYEAEVDEFKLLIGAPVDAEFEFVPAELDVNLPEYLGANVIELAEKYRLDLQTARDEVEDARRQVYVAQNLLLPDLDLVARGQTGNEAGTPARYLNDDAVTYSAAVELDLPIDRLRERNIYRRSLIQLERAQREFDALKDEVAADVRDSVREIRAAQVSLQIQRRGIELAERRVEFSNELLRQGKTDARNVVEAQNSLLSAQDLFTRAQADLQTEVLRFLRDTGMLRVDPDAGALGAAFDRRGIGNNSRSSTYVR